MVSTSMSVPADYQPGYVNYQPRYDSNNKRETQYSKGARKGKRYINSVYSYDADKEQRSYVPSYYEPISV